MAAPAGRRFAAGRDARHLRARDRLSAADSTGVSRRVNYACVMTRGRNWLRDVDDAVP